MGVWEKESVYIPPFRSYPTGSFVYSGAGITTVELLPEGNTYPTGAVACIPGTVDSSVWFPSADLDDTQNYQVYVDGVFKRMLFAKNASPTIGEI